MSAQFNRAHQRQIDAWAPQTTSIRVEASVLIGDRFPTYFIDALEGRSARNLRSTRDEADAKRIASEFATSYGVHIEGGAP